MHRAPEPPTWLHRPEDQERRLAALRVSQARRWSNPAERAAQAERNRRAAPKLARLTDAQALHIIQTTGQISARELARAYAVGRRTIDKIRAGQRYAWVREASSGPLR